MGRKAVYQILIGFFSVAALAACGSQSGQVTSSSSTPAEVAAALSQGKSEQLESGATSNIKAVPVNSTAGHAVLAQRDSCDPFNNCTATPTPTPTPYLIVQIQAPHEFSWNEGAALQLNSSISMSDGSGVRGPITYNWTINDTQLPGNASGSSYGFDAIPIGYNHSYIKITAVDGLREVATQYVIIDVVAKSGGGGPTTPPIDPDLVNPMVFDAYFYMDNYPDLAAAFAGDPSKATQHWVQTGAAEGRQGNALFIAKQYIAMYPGEVNDGDYVAAIKDYVAYSADYGLAGRFLLRAEIFNADAFFYYNDDVGQDLGYDPDQAAIYWVNQGIDEGRQGSDEFNAQSYMDRYPQMAARVNYNLRQAARNYILIGINQGRNAAP